MQNKKESKIFEFDPVIYPTRVWVTVDAPFEKVDKMFYIFDEDGEVIDNVKKEYESHLNAIATTFFVAHRKSRWKGCLVVIWRRNMCDSGLCAHEATHVYDWLDEEIGLGCQNLKNDEPKAYYVQWVANCISKVVKGKVT